MRSFRYLLFFAVVFGLLYFDGISAQAKSVKRGIAYGHNSEADLQAISEGLTWWYNWYVEPESPLQNSYNNYSLDFVPMVWNASSDTAKLRAFLKTHPSVKYILGFNEPNFKTQANLTPAEAAANWPRIEELADEFNLKIVGPAVNYCDQCVDIPGTNSDSDPVAYLDAFFDACTDCRIDYLAVHNYMCYSSALQSYIKGFLKYKKKIWLTEFACWDQSTITLDMQKSLVIGAIDYLENDTNIFRYSWFTGDRNGSWPYLDVYGKKPGELTDLGQLYVYFNPIHDDNSFLDIPGRIEAESYSKMSGIQLEAVKDYDGLADVGYFDAGDWLQYNVNVPESAEYYLYFRISSNANTSVSIKENGTVIKTITIPATGGWQNWKTFSQPITLSQGHHKLQIYTPTGSLNMNWIAFSKGINTAPTVIADEDTTITLPENSVYLTCNGSDQDNNTLTYKWTKQSGANSATIVSPTSPFTEISGLAKGEYVFRVTVSDGIDTTSDAVKVSVHEASGVETMQDKSYRIYPNPFIDELNIESNDKNEEASFEIVNTVGQTQLKGNLLDKATIQTIGLLPGIYFIKIKDNDNYKFSKIIKK
jgi:hypothetical protein